VRVGPRETARADLKIIGILFGGLGAVTAGVLFEPRPPHPTDLMATVAGNIIAVVLWIAMFLAYRRSQDSNRRHDLLAYGLVLPLVFYLSGFGYIAYTVRR
jgi:hypothetical protein